MKFKNEIVLVFTMIAILFLSSCNKDDAKTNNETISEEDAVEVVENSLQEDSGGINDQISSSIEMASDYADLEFNPYCGLTFDTLITQTNPSGMAILYEYSFDWEWEILCNQQQIPEKFNFSYDATGWCDAPRIKSTITGNHSFTLEGLSPGSNNIIYNGTFYCNGSNEMKIGLQSSFDSNVTIDATNVIISKETWKITGGTANVTFHGETTGGKVFDYSGTISYNQDGTATLKFENEFTIQL